METISLNKLNLGMTPDPRDRTNGVSRVLQHFDTTQKQKIVPYRDMVLDALFGFESSLNDLQITRILKANGNFYGSGVISSSDAHAQVYIKTTPTDPTSPWTVASSGSDPSFGGARNDSMFLHYKTTNKLYGGNNTGIWSYNLSSPTFTYNENTSIVAGPALVHSQDDTLYVLSRNVIASNNAGTWNNSALALPSDITSGDICEDGNYLSIAVNRLNGNVVEYLWDRDSSLTTTADNIDWGTGTLLFIEKIGGIKVAVFVDNSLIPKLILKYNTGTEIITIAEFQCTLATIGTWKQKYNNSLLFLAELTIDGNVLKGLWKLERTSTGFIFSLDRLPRNDTALGNGSLKGFYRTGDYVFVAYLNPTGNGFTIWRTNDQASFTATSTFESTINEGMPEADRTKPKKLLGLALSTEPLPVGGEANVLYRVDGGSWIPVISTTEEGSVTTEMGIDANGDQFTDGREYEFMATSNGGAEITEVKYKYQTTSSLL